MSIDTENGTYQCIYTNQLTYDFLNFLEVNVFNLPSTCYFQLWWSKSWHICPRVKYVNSLRPSDAYICGSRLTMTGSDNGLSSERCQAIIGTNAGILLIGHLGTNYSENLIKILIFSFTKNAIESVICEMAAILPRPQCVNSCRLSDITRHNMSAPLRHVVLNQQLDVFFPIARLGADQWKLHIICSYWEESSYFSTRDVIFVSTILWHHRSELRRPN